MPEKIERGKQQILFNYLPGRTFDFGKNSVAAKISHVRGVTFHELNNILIVRKIAEQASAWSEEYRPTLRNEVLLDESRFVIIDPKLVSSEIFPLVFWCSNSSCKKVFDFSRRVQLPHSRTCPSCHIGKLTQLRFIKVHKCGNIEPLTPPTCRICHSSEMALDDRGSERLSNFRWRCLNCNNVQSVFPGRCNRCTIPANDGGSQNMEIEVFRANRTFYVHTATLINVPQRKYDRFFNTIDWFVISTAKYLGLTALRDVKLDDYAGIIGNSGRMSSSVSEHAFGVLLDQLNKAEITIQQYTDEIRGLQSQANPTIEELKSEITERSGIDSDLWEEAKYNIIDSVIPYELGSAKSVQAPTALNKMNNLGITSLHLMDNFPIILASYGFSRLEYSPNDCQLNPFPPDREQGGRYPIYVDKVQADAIAFQLSHLKVINWLRINGFEITLPNGSNGICSAKGYFVQIFHNVNVYEKLFGDQPIPRLVMGLIHTFSHLAIRHAALLCGLDKTSISEYVVPRTLSFSLYCNHRFGATIGALTALFEQSPDEWLDQIDTERRCVYDPVCQTKGGNCHSCTHLAETSCKFFNLNLGRIYLFGGYDHELGREIVGYFDPRILST
jgi:hypothetical protein